MKIAITADPFLPVPPEFYGGIERIIYQLITSLSKEGHQVTLFAHRDSKVPCRLVPYPSASLGPVDHVRNTWTINKQLFSEKFDIIHSFGRLGYLLPQFPRRLPKLMSYQRDPTIDQIKKAVKLSYSGSLAFTGCSDHISEKIRPYARVHTVYNGIDTSAFVPTDQLPADAPLVFLGRIEPIKGTHVAIEIAKKAQRKLLIAGNIPADSEAYFNIQVKPHLDDQIIYLGAVNDHQKNDLLGRAAALLMPINWDEPFGIVMIEAIACGTPVIGFDRGAVPEVVKDGLSGFVVTDIDQAIAALERLGQIDRSLVRGYGAANFDFQKIARNYIKIYEEMIK